MRIERVPASLRVYIWGLSACAIEIEVTVERRALISRQGMWEIAGGRASALVNRNHHHGKQAR